MQCSYLNRLPATLRRVIVAGLMLHGSAAGMMAAPSLEISQSTFFNLQPGDEFTVLLRVNNPDAPLVVAYDYYLRSSVSGAFLLKEQTLNAPVNQPNSLESLPYSITSSDTNDFGAYNAAFSAGFGTGISTAQSLVFQIDASILPGNYILDFAWNQPLLTGGPSLLDKNGIEYQASAPLSVSVQVVPEPSILTLGMAAMGIVPALLSIFRRRRLRHMQKARFRAAPFLVSSRDSR